MGSRISSPAPILPTALDAQIRQRVAAIARYFRFGDLNNDIVVLEVAEFAQASPQRLDPISPSRNGAKGQEAHVPHLIALLRPCRERHAAATPNSVINSRRLNWSNCIRFPPARAGLQDIQLARISRRQRARLGCLARKPIAPGVVVKTHARRPLQPGVVACGSSSRPRPARQRHDVVFPRRRHDAGPRFWISVTEAIDCGPAPCVICSWDRIVPSSER